MTIGQYFKARREGQPIPGEAPITGTRTSLIVDREILVGQQNNMPLRWRVETLIDGNVTSSREVTACGPRQAQLMAELPNRRHQA